MLSNQSLQFCAYFDGHQEPTQCPMVTSGTFERAFLKFMFLYSTCKSSSWKQAINLNRHSPKAKFHHKLNLDYIYMTF